MNKAIKTIDEYLAPIPEDKRTALERLRTTIHETCHGLEECINYGIAAFRHKGKMLVGFGATANHCAFYPCSGSTVATFKDELRGWETSKAAIRFQVDKPLPDELVRKLVLARIVEHDSLLNK